MKVIKVAGNTIYIFKTKVIDANTYCFIEGNDALLIDAVQSDELQEFLLSREIKRIAVLLTHGHYDHIMSIPNLKNKFDTVVICAASGKDILENPRKNLSAVANHINFFRKDSQWEKEELDKIIPFRVTCDFTLNDRDVYKWKNLEFQMICTPGHSADSVFYLFCNTYLFSGDSLLKGRAPILRFPGGNVQDYMRYTKPIILSFPDTVEVLPGHGERFKIPEGTVL